MGLTLNVLPMRTNNMCIGNVKYNNFDASGTWWWWRWQVYFYYDYYYYIGYYYCCCCWFLTFCIGMEKVEKGRPKGFGPASISIFVLTDCNKNNTNNKLSRYLPNQPTNSSTRKPLQKVLLAGWSRGKHSLPPPFNHWGLIFRNNNNNNKLLNNYLLKNYWGVGKLQKQFLTTTTTMTTMIDS